MADEVAANLKPIPLLNKGCVVAYQVLARQWRPKTFSSLRGQEQVTRALTNALKRQQVHHAYLFTGTRGVGKTTIARILAKALNCQKGITPEPCGECAACIEIDNGRSVDLIEVDGASRTRVEDTRELLDNVQYAPTASRFKIYLIDEVHMLSGHSFNALLKTLEEPPAHVKFILATTDPERIPVTVLSRCLRLSLKALSSADIFAQLQDIVNNEKIPYELGALQRIARLGAGSMRDAISLLEQAIAYSNLELKTNEVDELFGLSYYRYLPSLLQALADEDLKQCLAIVEEIATVGADYEKILGSLLQSLHAIALAQALPEESASLAALAEIDEATLAVKDKLSQEAVQLLYQIGLTSQKDLRFAPDMRTGFEMTLLRMALFKPRELSDGNKVTQRPVPSKVPAPLTVPPAMTTPAPMIATAVSQVPIAAPVREPSPVVAVSPNDAPPAPAPVVAPAAVSVQANLASSASEINWLELSAKLPLSGLTRMLVKHCILTKWDGRNMVLTLEESQKTLVSPLRLAQIQDALKSQLGVEVKLTIELGVVQGTTLMMQEQTQLAERQQQAVRSVEEDPIVQSLVSTFDAKVEDIKAV
ncbi:DNA polymerase III subunit gamma/tau [Candidatus Berkiella aquae]|uniref:DNA polymerase III subunit gamma/tau n=1 Tax=Candidatus Berkiella aquae TaxID=295108 RepID=A0AAE3HZ67_9GAMM|nr:DNA polymerase III subunit gamma/tau [Candidatus Berkiella aquae]MCS5712284.1 DNA polymerase III subunit gamma/tau [Candidatus Berkiella aquae]